MSHFIRNANTFRVASNDALDIHDKLPVGCYTVCEDQFGGMFLQTVDAFTAPSKLYGDTNRRADRILNTYRVRPASTGVMLTGEKGSGKTLLAKTLSIRAAELGFPTILVNNPFTGDKFNKLIQDIDQECVIIFDEFEKVYDKEDQEQALTLLDGVYPSKKLFVITCNDKWRVNEHMRNRPGRIFYMIEFKGLGPDFIREYCNDNLNQIEHIERIVDLAALFDEFNFDMLKALVEEMNRYGETPAEALTMLNAKPEYNGRAEFEFVGFSVDGKEIEKQDLDRNSWSGNPLTQPVHFEYDPQPDNDDSNWIRITLRPNDIKKVDADKGTYAYVTQNGITFVMKRVKEEYYNRYMDV